MRVVAIDSSTENCTVAVGTDAADPVLISRAIGRGHAEALPGMLSEAMAAAGLAWREVERIAVTVGPGSFTGVRIGVAAARGLALVVGGDLVGITTLAVHAAAARRLAGAVAVLALIPARGNDLYGQCFATDGRPIAMPEIADQGDFAARAAGDPTLHLAGPGAPAIAAGLAPERLIHADTAPDPAALLHLAETSQPAAEPPKPLYLRPPDAVPPKAGVARQ